MGELHRREVLYRGAVQGVGFRYSTRRVAAGFRVVGYVQNMSDGRVKMVAEGSGTELDRFLAAVFAEMNEFIDDAHVTTLPATGEFSRFTIRF